MNLTTCIRIGAAAAVILTSQIACGQSVSLTNKDGKTIEVEITGFTGKTIKVSKGGKPFEIKPETLDVASLNRLKEIVEGKMKAEQEAKTEALKKLGPYGWNDARWGMTFEQIKDAYPAAIAVKLRGGEPPRSPLILEEFTIAELPFKVSFVMPGNKGLEAVVVEHQTDLPTRWQFDKLEELLTGKYGPPAKQDHKDEDFNRSYLWITEGARIRLSELNRYKKPPEYSVLISYTPRDAEAEKKL